VQHIRQKNGLQDRTEQEDEDDDGDEDHEAQDLLQEAGSDQNTANDSTTATITERKLEISQKSDVMWARILADEGHALRHPTSAISAMFRALPRRNIHLITATPTINRLENIRGLVEQISITADLPFDSNTKGMSEAEACMDDKYPFMEIDYTVKENATADFPSLLLDGADPEKIVAVKEYVRTTNNKPWCITPSFLAHIVGDADDRSKISDKIYRGVLDCVQTRRTMRDAVTVVIPGEGGESDNDEVYFPGQDIPPSAVIMEELGYKGLHNEDEEQIANLVNALNENLITVSSDGSDHLPDFMDGKWSGSGSNSVQWRLNMHIHRLLSLYSFDLRTVTVIATEDKISANVTAENVAQATMLKGASSYRGPLPTKAGAAKGRAKRDSKPYTTLGVNQVNNLINMDPDGGLTYLWFLCDYGRVRALPPVEQTHMLHWAVARSPVLTRIVELVAKNCDAKERTLVVVDNQYCQQYVSIMLLSWLLVGFLANDV
jgi:hypothetical protein